MFQHRHPSTKPSSPLNTSLLRFLKIFQTCLLQEKTAAEKEKCHHTRVRAIMLALQKRTGRSGRHQVDHESAMWQRKSAAQGDALEKSMPAGKGSLSCPSTRQWWDNKWNALSGSELSITKEMGMYWNRTREDD